MLGSPVVRHGSELGCRCASCGRDVRRSVPTAHLALRWRRVTAARSHLQKLKLVACRVVCSEMCAQRLRRVEGWEFQLLSLWTGPLAFTQFEELVRSFWMDRTMHHETLPALLYALSIEPKPTVMKIRPEIQAVIVEAKQALGK